MPRSNNDIPKSGDVNKIAGTNPIKALIKAVTTNEIIISPILIGAIIVEFEPTKEFLPILVLFFFSQSVFQDNQIIKYMKNQDL